MAAFLAHVRYFAGALALLAVIAVATPSSAQAPGQVNPTAQSVNEDKLFQQLNQLDGRVSIPDTRSGVLIQPAGQAWRDFHQNTLTLIGGIAIVGMLALLIVFYSVRGMIKLSSGKAGRTVTRFNGFERFTHWLTASTFIILAISGINLTFGKTLLLPLIGPEAFTTFSQWGKYAHNYLSFPFAIGLICIFFIWLKDNIPNKVDVEWLKQGGGIVGKKHPAAYRFNAGQKVVYWIVVLGGFAVAISGYLLMFPFYGTGIAGMQLAQIIHGIVGVLMIAAMLAHIYIGTIGMEGAFDAMGTGEVDLNWAKEHHKLWVEEEMGKNARGARMTPAE